MKAVFLILLATKAYGACGVPEALAVLRPGAEWYVNGDIVEWRDKIQAEPSRSEIDQAIIDCKLAETIRQAEKAKALTDVNNKVLTDSERIDAIAILLDLDKSTPSISPVSRRTR